MQKLDIMHLIRKNRILINSKIAKFGSTKNSEIFSHRIYWCIKNRIKYFIDWNSYVSKNAKIRSSHIKMTENHSIHIRIPIVCFSEYQSEIFDENFIQWDENEKKHAIQINCILNIMTPHVNQINNIENIEM